MMRNLHDRFESLAGAIALGEANEAERAEFAAHLGACQRCRAQSGGEVELVRIRNIVANARESETWSPDLSAPIRVAMLAQQRRKVRIAFGALGGAVAASLVLHVALGSGFFARMQTAFADPPTIKYEGQRIVLEPRSARDRHEAQARHALPEKVRQTVVLVAAAPSLTTTADQIVAKRSTASFANVKPKAALKTELRPKLIAQVGAPALSPPVLGGTTAEARPLAPLRPGAGDVPAFAPGKQSAANVVGSAPQDVNVVPAAKAAPLQETLAIAPSYVSRDPVPEGGEVSIPAEYSQLARGENAEGTVGVEVAVDANGNALSCTIVQPSGYLVLDDLMCKAVKKVHYRSAMANGKPVPGTFRFSRTFKLE